MNWKCCYKSKNVITNSQTHKKMWKQFVKKKQMEENK